MPFLHSRKGTQASPRRQIGGPARGVAQPGWECLEIVSADVCEPPGGRARENRKFIPLSAKPTIRNLVAEVTQAAKALSLQPHLAAARNPDEIDGAFASIIAERAQAVFVFPSSMLFSQRKRVVELITKHALPATFPAREYAQLGGLMAFMAPASPSCGGVALSMWTGFSREQNQQSCQ